MDAESVRKTLKIINLTTTNAILMKRGTIMYIPKIFHFPKNWGVQDRALQSIKEKRLRM